MSSFLMPGSDPRPGTMNHIRIPLLRRAHDRQLSASRVCRWLALTAVSRFQEGHAVTWHAASPFWSLCCHSGQSLWSCGQRHGCSVMSLCTAPAQSFLESLLLCRIFCEPSGCDPPSEPAPGLQNSPTPPLPGLSPELCRSCSHTSLSLPKLFANRVARAASQPIVTSTVAAQTEESCTALGIILRRAFRTSVEAFVW